MVYSTQQVGRGPPPKHVVIGPDTRKGHAGQTRTFSGPLTRAAAQKKAHALNAGEQGRLRETLESEERRIAQRALLSPAEKKKFDEIQAQIERLEGVESALVAHRADLAESERRAAIAHSHAERAAAAAASREAATAAKRHEELLAASEITGQKAAVRLRLAQQEKKLEQERARVAHRTHEIEAERRRLGEERRAIEEERRRTAPPPPPPPAAGVIEPEHLEGFINLFEGEGRRKTPAILTRIKKFFTPPPKRRGHHPAAAHAAAVEEHHAAVEAHAEPVPHRVEVEEHFFEPPPPPPPPPPPGYRSRAEMEAPPPPPPVRAKPPPKGATESSREALLREIAEKKLRRAEKSLEEVEASAEAARSGLVGRVAATTVPLEKTPQQIFEERKRAKAEAAARAAEESATVAEIAGGRRRVKGHRGGHPKCAICDALRYYH